MDFDIEPSVQKDLDWVTKFVRDELEPLDLLVADPLNIEDPLRNELIRPLQKCVKERGLWACHLGPELGGRGYGQLHLALLNEVLGQSRCAPVVFGCQAPDSGNAEILAMFGSAEHKARYLQPLLDGEIMSCFSMTEPQGGADPKVFRTTAVRDGDEWVINGEKWFSSGYDRAAFIIVMAVTDLNRTDPYRSMSMFIVPKGTPGLTRIRNSAVYGRDRESMHAYLRYSDVRVPACSMLGEEGSAFAVAQARLGGGRVHHAMRTVGSARKAFDMMCERALSRFTQGGPLADKQLVQAAIADSWIELEQFRLLVLRTAWRIDRHQDYKKVRGDIAAIKIALPRVLSSIAARAVQMHGSLGVSSELPLAGMVVHALTLGIADGPTEVHQVTLARQVLREYEPAPGLFPTQHLPTLRAHAEERFAALLDTNQDDPTP